MLLTIPYELLHCEMHKFLRFNYTRNLPYPNATYCTIKDTMRIMTISLSSAPPNRANLEIVMALTE